MTAHSTAIMQPYFIPYVGYFQLINYVDSFVILDDAKYTKKGWINRNFLTINGEKKLISIPLSKASDYKKINEREISKSYSPEKVFDLITQNYSKSPNWVLAKDLIQEIIFFEERNLSNFIVNSIKIICNFLDISTPIYISSQIPNLTFKSKEEKILKICNFFESSRYVNPFGGINLYNKSDFYDKNMELNFMLFEPSESSKASIPFLETISTLDLILKVDLDKLKNILKTQFLIL